MSTELKPCDTSPDCLHRPCKDCGAPMRHGHTYAADHPGAIRHIRGGSCQTCSWHDVSLLPDDLKDQRHMLLTDAELARMRDERPEAYQWHVRRREHLYEQEVEAILRDNLPITAEKLDFLAALQSRPQ